MTSRGTDRKLTFTHAETRERGRRVGKGNGLGKKNPHFNPKSQRRKRMPDLSEVLAYLTENQILLVVAAFLLAFLGYALVKRLLKLALFAAVFLGIYAGLVYLLA